jgi:hypothetical protein
MKYIQIEAVKNVIFRRWMTLLIFSLGGAVIGVLFAYINPPLKIKYIAEIGLRVGVDPIMAVYEIKATLPKCSIDKLQIPGRMSMQTISIIKASPGLIALIVEGSDKTGVEDCLKMSVDFILTYQNQNIEYEINALQKEIIAIDQALFLRKNDDGSIGFSDNSRATYPQELLLRKYKILREIHEIKKGSAHLFITSSHQISIISFVVLRSLIGTFLGLLFAIAMIFFRENSFRMFSTPRL